MRPLNEKIPFHPPDKGEKRGFVWRVLLSSNLGKSRELIERRIVNKQEEACSNSKAGRSPAN